MGNTWQVQDAKARFSEMPGDELGRRTANRHQAGRRGRSARPNRAVAAAGAHDQAGP